MARLFLIFGFTCLFLSADRNYWIDRIEEMKNAPKFVGRQIPKSVLKKAEERIYSILESSVHESDSEPMLKSWIVYLRAAVLIELQKSLIDNDEDIAQRKQDKIALARFESAFKKIEKAAEKSRQAPDDCYKVAQAYLDYSMRPEPPHESVKELVEELETRCE